MKKSILVFFSLIALVGILNCVLIEPAHAYKEDKAASAASSEDSDCCFFCCSIHHQWLTAAPGLDLFTHLIAALLNPSSFSAAPAPPPGAIFHPPLAV